MADRLETRGAVRTPKMRQPHTRPCTTTEATTEDESRRKGSGGGAKSVIVREDLIITLAAVFRLIAVSNPCYLWADCDASICGSLCPDAVVVLPFYPGEAGEMRPVPRLDRVFSRCECNSPANHQGRKSLQNGGLRSGSCLPGYTGFTLGIHPFTLAWTKAV